MSFCYARSMRERPSFESCSTSCLLSTSLGYPIRHACVCAVHECMDMQSGDQNVFCVCLPLCVSVAGVASLLVAKWISDKVATHSCWCVQLDILWPHCIVFQVLILTALSVLHKDCS